MDYARLIRGRRWFKPSLATNLDNSTNKINSQTISGSSHMAKKRLRYTTEQKTKIINAVTTTRKTGSWADAYTEAQKNGYKGGLDSLKQLLRASTTTKPKENKSKGPGRPKGSKNKLTVVPPGKKTSDVLTAAVNQAYNEAIDKAIAALQAQKR